jgi:hypothetical protein
MQNGIFISVLKSVTENCPVFLPTRPSTWMADLAKVLGNVQSLFGCKELLGGRFGKSNGECSILVRLQRASGHCKADSCIARHARAHTIVLLYLTFLSLFLSRYLTFLSLFCLCRPLSING